MHEEPVFEGYMESFGLTECADELKRKNRLLTSLWWERHAPLLSMTALFALMFFTMRYWGRKVLFGEGGCNHYREVVRRGARARINYGWFFIIVDWDRFLDSWKCEIKEIGAVRSF